MKKIVCFTVVGSALLVLATLLPNHAQAQPSKSPPPTGIDPSLWRSGYFDPPTKRPSPPYGRYPMPPSGVRPIPPYGRYPSPPVVRPPGVRPMPPYGRYPSPPYGRHPMPPYKNGRYPMPPDDHVPPGDRPMPELPPGVPPPNGRPIACVCQGLNYGGNCPVCGPNRTFDR